MTIPSFLLLLITALLCLLYAVLRGLLALERREAEQKQRESDLYLLDVIAEKYLP